MRPDLLVARGALYLDNQQSYILAIADFKQAIFLDSTDINALYNTSLTYYKENQYDSAIVFANKAIAKGNTNSYFVKALSYYQKKEHDHSLQQAILAREARLQTPDSLLVKRKPD